VQPDVDEVRGDVLKVGPGTGGVGYHHGDAVRAEQLDQRRIAVAGENPASRAASNGSLGDNCHSNGPSLAPNASTPEAKKFANGV